MSKWEYDSYSYIFVSGVLCYFYVLDVSDKFDKFTHGVVGYYGISNKYIKM